jgi:hypothetical protein
MKKAVLVLCCKPIPTRKNPATGEIHAPSSACSDACLRRAPACRRATAGCAEIARRCRCHGGGGLNALEADFEPKAGNDAAHGAKFLARVAANHRSTRRISASGSPEQALAKGINRGSPRCTSDSGVSPSAIASMTACASSASSGARSQTANVQPV